MAHSGKRGELKDLLGVDSIVDLIKAQSGGDLSWKGKLVEMGAASRYESASVVPWGPLHAGGQDMHADSAGAPPAMRGQPCPIRAATDIPPATLPGQPTAVAPLQPAAPQTTRFPRSQSDVSNRASGAGSHRGVLDDRPASLVMQLLPSSSAKYPQFVSTVFKPLLENRDQVMLFAKNTPPLSHIANDEEFPESLTVHPEMLHPTDEDPGSSRRKYLYEREDYEIKNMHRRPGFMRRVGLSMRRPAE